MTVLQYSWVPIKPWIYTAMSKQSQEHLKTNHVVPMDFEQDINGDLARNILAR